MKKNYYKINSVSRDKTWMWGQMIIAAPVTPWLELGLLRSKYEIVVRIAAGFNQSINAISHPHAAELWDRRGESRQAAKKERMRQRWGKNLRMCGGKWGEKTKAFIFIFLCHTLIRQASVSWILKAGKGEEGGRHNTLTWDQEGSRKQG